MRPGRVDPGFRPAPAHRGEQLVRRLAVPVGPVLTLGALDDLTLGERGRGLMPGWSAWWEKLVLASAEWTIIWPIAPMGSRDLSLARVGVPPDSASDLSVVLIGAEQVVKRPKTAAGIRTVAFPMWLVPLVEAHFRDYSELKDDGAVFVGPYGKPPTRPNFSSIWARAIKAADLPGVHFHDLRHTGNHFAAMSGASTRELMGRMGHVSVDAALVYQHRTASRDRAIADALDRMVGAWISTSSGHVGGTPDR